MKIYLTTTAKESPWSPFARWNYIRILRSAWLSGNLWATIVDSPDVADLVVFVDPCRQWQIDVLLNPIFKKHSEKSIVLDFSDQPTPFLPGLYACLSKGAADPNIHQSIHYLRVADNSLIAEREQEASTIRREFLFSFVGNKATSPDLRGKVLALAHTEAFLRESCTMQTDNDRVYIDIILKSQFVLAPKGRGTSSWRLFEAMRLSRAPVIISDNWVAPVGVDWSACSLRIDERDISKLPGILEDNRKYAEELGRRARMEWDRHFSSETMFAWLISRLSEVLEGMQSTAYPGRGYLALLRKLRTNQRISAVSELGKALRHGEWA